MMDLIKTAKENPTATALLIIAFLIIISYFAATYISGGASGHAYEIPTKEAVLEQLQTALPNIETLSEMGDFTMCLIVNMPKEKYSYQVNKINGQLTIDISENWLCNGVENEDFIISYVSYSRLQTHMHLLPKFDALQSANARNFYIFPSKLIAEGFTLVNPEEFQQRFPILYARATGTFTETENQPTETAPAEAIQESSEMPIENAGEMQTQEAGVMPTETSTEALPYS